MEKNHGVGGFITTYLIEIRSAQDTRPLDTVDNTFTQITYIDRCLSL
jgi:hypothetical protein